MQPRGPSEQPSDPQQESQEQRDRYSDGQDHEGDAQDDGPRPKQVADNNRGTPERAGNDERAGLIERWRERCPRQRRVFDASRGERQGLPPSRSVGK